MYPFSSYSSPPTLPFATIKVRVIDFNASVTGFAIVIFLNSLLELSHKALDEVQKESKLLMNI
jgi:hypothetical protein